jgi:cation:H+ antiporter
MIWLQSIVIFLLALFFLVWSAGRFITASTVFARHFGLSSLTIGLLLLGFGTSFPEILVSIFASVKGNPQLAIGNVIGSNIANKALVGGFAALVSPLIISSKIIKRELPILIILSLLVGALLFEGYLNRLDGVIMLLLFMLYLAIAFYFSMKEQKDEYVKELQKEIPESSMSLKLAFLWWILSLSLLLLSSHFLVVSATTMAKLLGVSNFIIGLTIVAIGTSLPEMASSIVCSLRKDYDMAIGNVVGSSVFNLLPVFAMPALISPTKLSHSFLYRDYPAMCGFFVLFWLLIVLPPKRYCLGRFSGLTLLFSYIAYIVWVV